MVKSNNGLVSDEEAGVLWRALSEGEGREPTTDEFQRFLEWAGKTRASFALLDMVLDGTFVAQRDKDSYSFMFSRETKAREALRLPPE